MKIIKNTAGFTLIEMVITVAIVSILAAVAIPSYQEQVKKARRADVKDLLTDCAAAQARNYSTASPPTYLDRTDLIDANLCNGSGLIPNTLLSKEGFYQITAVRNDECDTAIGTNWCFLLIANPAPGSPQAADALCQRWTIDHADNRSANSRRNSSAAATDTTAACW